MIEIHSFLGLAGYYRCFLQNFSSFRSLDLQRKVLILNGIVIVRLVFIL
jgi:hypothetical protein